jgi:glycosyltransferase EpsF
MLRVLHIIGGMDRAGAETMVMNLYRNIDKTQIQFDFLYFKSKVCDYDEEIEELGGEIFRIVTTNPLLRFLKVYLFLKNNNYKIVHAHTLFNIGLNLLAAMLAKAPVRIAHSHNTQTKDKGLIGSVYQHYSRYLIKATSTDFIACGEAAGNFLFGFNKDIYLLKNSIDVNHFNKIGKNKRDYWLTNFNIKESTLKIVQVGRLQTVKNHKFSLELCKEMKQQNIDFRLLIVGQGELKNQINESILKYDLENEVIMLGVREDVAELMAGADIHFMPSHHEGFPVVLVEAQAIGLPSVVSNCISKEVDLGLDLIKFVDLSITPKVWCNEILNIKGIRFINKKIVDILIDKGFDSKQNAAMLQRLYLSK